VTNHVNDMMAKDNSYCRLQLAASGFWKLVTILSARRQNYRFVQTFIHRDKR